MNKTITITPTITPALERDIVNFCEDELNYHINTLMTVTAENINLKLRLR